MEIRRFYVVELTLVNDCILLLMEMSKTKVKIYYSWRLDINAREKVSFMLYSTMVFIRIFSLCLDSTTFRENFHLATIPIHTIFKVSRFRLALLSNHVLEKSPLR